MSKARPTLEERLQSLQQGFFGRNRELKEADPIEPTPMSIPLERIRLLSASMVIDGGVFRFIDGLASTRNAMVSERVLAWRYGGGVLKGRTVVVFILEVWICILVG